MVAMPAEHGTRTRYQQDRCRCPDCRQANANFVRRWRAASPGFAAGRKTTRARAVDDNDCWTRQEIVGT